MATETITTLNGLFKERYGEDGVTDLVPEFSIIAEDVPFMERVRLGDSFNFPVRLKRSNGWTFSAAVGTAFALNTPIAGVLKNATVSGTEFVNRVQIPYGVVTRSAQVTEAAFADAHDEIVLDMVNSAAAAREMTLLYGESATGLGDIASQSGSGGTRALVISEATWSPAIWAAMDGALLDCYDSPGGTKQNSNGDITVTSIDFSTRTINVSGDATDLTACGANDFLLPKGADGAWFDGIDSILTNTGSLFGIDAATYPLWAGTTKSAGSAAATLATFVQAQTETMVLGGSGDMVFYLSPYTYADLTSDVAGLRRFTQDSSSKMQLGTQELEFYGPGGKMTLKAHPFVKAGEAFGLRLNTWKRIGSSDITFRLGVTGQGEGFFREMPDAAGYELRNFWHQGVICTAPRHNVKITGIDNTSL